MQGMRNFLKPLEFYEEQLTEQELGDRKLKSLVRRKNVKKI